MSRQSIFAVVAVAFLVPGIATAQNAAVAKQIEANERAVDAAVVKGDVAAFSKLVAADGISVDGAGPMAVSEFIKIFPQAKFTSTAIDQVKVTSLNETTALITYRWTGKGTMMGQPVPSPTIASSVWVNRGGTWMVVYHQETPATPAPAAKK